MNEALKTGLKRIDRLLEVLDTHDGTTTLYPVCCYEGPQSGLILGDLRMLRSAFETPGNWDAGPAGQETDHG